MGAFKTNHFSRMLMKPILHVQLNDLNNRCDLPAAGRGRPPAAGYARPGSGAALASESSSPIKQKEAAMTPENRALARNSFIRIMTEAEAASPGGAPA